MNPVERFEALRGQVNLLDDKRAIDCLSVVLADEFKDSASIYRSPEDASYLLAGVMVGRNLPLSPLKDNELRNLPGAARALLITMLEDEGLQDRVEAALKVCSRDMLLEPVSGILIISGVLMVLKTRFDVKFKRGPDKKWTLEGGASSPSLSEKFLTKVMDIFGA